MLKQVSHVCRRGRFEHSEKDRTTNEKRLCHADDIPHQVSSSSDHHYTTLGFTDGLGQPVCCCVILAGETNTILNVLGVDMNNLKKHYIRVSDMSDEDLIRMMEEKYNDTRKIFPGGPTCHVGDKVIPTFITCSPSGGITAKILTQCVRHIDKYLALDGSVVTPSLVLDGHNSRFDFEFLTYIYPAKGTHIILTRKRSLYNYHSGVNLTKHDIIPLVNYAWKYSFAVVESNRVDPLNYNLLNHIELQDNIRTLNPTEKDLISEEELTNNNLNCRCGYASRAIFDLLQVAQRDTEMKKKIRENKGARTNTLKSLDNVKQLRAGKLYRSGEVVLGLTS